MPYYSELGLPSSSAYSSLFLPGPYSNHSSIIASNFSHPTPLSRQYRGGYKPHLSTITELGRIKSPKLLYHTSPKVSVRPIKKIDTADIDVSVNKYKRYDKYEKPKVESVEKKPPSSDKSPSPKRSPRGSLEEKEQSEAKPNPNIRRDRPTVRLHTVHKDTLKQEIGAFRSWRDNFKPEELEFKPEDFSTEPKRLKKTPGEVLKEKFLIRSRSKENILKPESKKITRKRSVKKSPSFQDICEAITCDNIGEDLNPGQSEEVHRKQSRQISGERLLKEIRRNSTDLSEDDIKLLDAILSEQKKNGEAPKVEKADAEIFNSRGSVRKKKLTKKKSNDNFSSDEDIKKPVSRLKKSQSKEKLSETEVTSPIERRSTKKRLRKPSLDESVEQEEKIIDPLTEQIYQNTIRDISQVEIEQTAFKPKPVITGSGEIEETKPSLKAVVNNIEVKESPKVKREKKFRFNVIVEVEDEYLPRSRSPTPDDLKPRRKPKITADKINLMDKTGAVKFPKGKEPVISSILKKRPFIHVGRVVQENEKIEKTDETPKQEITEECTPSLLRDDSKTENKSTIEDTLTIESKVSENNKNTELEKLQRGISSSSNSKESSPVPASPTLKDTFLFNKILPNKENISALNSKEGFSPTSPTVKEKNLFNKILSKKDNTSASSLTSKTPSGSRDSSLPSTPVSNGQHSFEEVYLSAPSSPMPKFDTAPSSPEITQLNVFNEVPGQEAPQSPLINAFNNEVTEKEDTPPASPLVSNENIFSKIIVENCNEIVKGIPEMNSESESKIFIEKDENDNTINVFSSSQESETEEKAETTELNKKLISKRSLVQKANKDDPDLLVFIPPPEPEPEPVPEQQEEKKDEFVPLQSNRFSQWMNPFKKPEQFDVCPVEIFARPKDIRGRHYPRPRGQPAPPPPPSKPEESSSEEEDDEDTEEETSSEEETASSDEECEESAVNNKGASTSSNDSGFGSGALSRNKDCDVNIHKKCEKLTANLCGVNQKLVVEAIESVRKGSLESRDSPTSNHANNPAFALDSGDIPEEYSQSSTYTGFQKSGRITPPATTIPRFRKYCVDDFNFLKVLGKGSFGKVLLAELKGTEYYYAVKCLKKDVVLEDDDVECTLIERKVLALGTRHPYLCHLLCTFQTESHLFFVMEYLNGGDLMFHIQASGRFPEHQARFYGAEIVSGLKYLHNKGIVYRDLKLDNVLLDFDGHVRIADFGMCKLQIFLDRMAETFCGTPDYMAPEIIKGQHYNQGVDWWSFGVLLYEMLLGQSPFSGCDEDELFWSICNEKPVLPRYLSAEATNILTMFLEKDSSKRLGNRYCPHGDIQDQAFFRPIDWHKLEARQLEPPFKPNLQHPLDTQYFDKHFTVEKAKLTPIETTILQSMDQAQFQGFSYTNPNATDK